MWSENAYLSDDIDLIPLGINSRRKIRKVMFDLGFFEKNRYFVHPDHVLWVEFPAGPLGVGEEPPRKLHRLSIAFSN